jgi:hypothetical protein
LFASLCVFRAPLPTEYPAPEACNATTSDCHNLVDCRVCADFEHIGSCHLQDNDIEKVANWWMDAC